MRTTFETLMERARERASRNEIERRKRLARANRLKKKEEETDRQKLLREFNELVEYISGEAKPKC